MLKIKPMIYSKNRKIDLLCNDIYEGYHYYVLNLGTHPTAYIEIPKRNKMFGKDYDDIDLCVHRGLTYSDDKLRISEGTTMTNSWFIGWDYAHYNDYLGYEEGFSKELQTDGKKWTTEELIEECKNAINQLKKK